LTEIDLFMPSRKNIERQGRVWARPAALIFGGSALLGLAIRGGGEALFGRQAAAFPGSLVFFSVCFFCAASINLSWSVRAAMWSSASIPVRRFSTSTRLLYVLAGLTLYVAVASAILTPLAWAWPLGLTIGMAMCLVGSVDSARTREDARAAGAAERERDGGDLEASVKLGGRDSEGLMTHDRLRIAADDGSAWKSDQTD
jgi:hypothetical protein